MRRLLNDSAIPPPPARRILGAISLARRGKGRGWGGGEKDRFPEICEFVFSSRGEEGEGTLRDALTDVSRS